MKKCKATLLFVLVCGFLLSTVALSQPSNFRGKLTWATGAPAIGLEIKLQQNGNVLGITYTNERGLYAFFNINAPRNGLVIIVSDSYRVLKEVSITGIEPNGELPDIAL